MPAIEQHEGWSTRLPRRDLVRAGGLGAFGLALGDLLATQAPGALTRRVRARSCILFFLEGGPAHQDLWDLKPDAPAEVRGEFRPIDTTVPGIQLCEHLPLLARQMHHVSLVRSVRHEIVDHNAGSYYALTGRSPVVGSRLIIGDESENFPPFGAVFSRFEPPVAHTVPGFVHLPDIMSNNGRDLPGQRAGFLGPAHDPLVAGDPSVTDYEVPGLGLPPGVAMHRLNQRRRLLDALDQSAGGAWNHRWADLGAHYERAFSLLSAEPTRRAFNLGAEPPAVRERYGLPDRVDRSVEARRFGGLPHLGQCLLMARRLIEAGVRLVTVCTGRRFDQSWDTHRDHFPLLKKSLIPYFDRAFSALLEDLSQRGLLDETLVVAMGEFGRTPRLGQITSGAGADAAGRDHWPHCYSVLFAGGGIRGGTVYGSSDRFAAYPKSQAVSPADIAATIYKALGLDPQSVILDGLDRPHVLATGQAIEALVG
jgi:hypothetical protein